MNVHPDEVINYNLPDFCKELLAQYRAFRGFNENAYIELKKNVINRYFERYGLSAGVIGVSGGVDSAVALALMVSASKEKNSKITKILPVFLPVHNKSATNQMQAHKKAKELCDVFGLELKTLDLTQTHEDLSTKIEKEVLLDSNSWGRGQFVAHCRTPSLYYCTTLLTANKLPAIVIGTTNKDEGTYLGYVGKASDGLVDLQIISDLHKSEVFKVGSYLGVPCSILDAVPHGDLYDGRSDIELFGASYDFVEMYHYIKQIPSLVETVTDEAYEKFCKNLEQLHAYNRHKYFSCSPAVHLDVIADISTYPQCSRTNLKFSEDFKGLIASDDFKKEAVLRFIELNRPYLGIKLETTKEGSLLISNFNFDFGLYEKLL